MNEMIQIRDHAWIGREHIRGAYYLGEILFLLVNSDKYEVGKDFLVKACGMLGIPVSPQ